MPTVIGDPKVSDAMQWISNNGLAVVLLLAIFYAAWCGSKWFGKNVIVPMKDAAITHLNDTNEALKANAKVNEKVSDNLDLLHADIKDIKKSVDGGGCRYVFKDAGR